ncbi:MAG: HAMP domain-containing sensor histidine kinase [Pseudomonadota bacterium]|nr:HAMP domain-containing sensor histidine kinase [Pseudomonadota bacterium]
MRRLYFQIYLTVAGSLLLFGMLASAVWIFAADRAYDGGVLEGARALATEILPRPERPVVELQRALKRIQKKLPVALAVHDRIGARLASAGGEIPPLPKARTESGRFHVRGAGPVWALKLDDGRWLLARPLHPWGPPVVRVLVLLGLLALAVALAAYPLVRRTTRRLERLQGRVEALGAGDLAARVKVEGRDEVAALARSFNHAAERIEALVGAHKTLLANASHELRSPLARLRMHLEMLQDGADLDRKREAQRDIAELDQLVGEILLASRLDAGTEPKGSEPVDLLALLAEESMRAGAELSGSNAQVQGDPRLLHRLFRNLLENARRHGGGEPVEVLVGDAPDRWVEVRVCDRGPGVPPEERERIFEPFYRPAGTREGHEGGFGLGLALVRQIAERHRGGVSYLPRDGGGSCFRVRLPRDDAG